MAPPDLLSQSIRNLAQHLAAGDLSSVEVTRAFLERIEVVQSTFRPLAIPFGDEALDAARQSDTRREKNAVLSPLDGVPLTIKESVDVKGHPSTLGLSSRKGKNADTDAVVTGILRSAGAVFLGKTNISQALLFHESRNPVYGQTVNPFHDGRSPGGSSGGEGAAIASYASPAGVGTDVGGSIRIPAAWNGICGLKPTNDRWSNIGSRTAIAGQELVRGQIGPMARTVDDLAFLLEIVTPEKCAARDPRTAPLPIPSYKAVDVRKLKVGFYVDDGLVSPSPAIVRAVDEAHRALSAAGATVVPLPPTLIDDALFTYYAGFSADGARTLLDQLDPSDLDVALKPLFRLARLPSFARKAASKILGMRGEKHLSHLLEVMGEKSVAHLWRLTRRAREISGEVLSAWDKLGIDVVICPVHATPALPHTESRDFSLAGSYSMFFNIVNFPAGTVPVTTVRPHETELRQQSTQEPTSLDRRAISVDTGSTGLPVGVQVVARPFREEHVLAAMAVIESAASKVEGFPRFPLPH